MYQQEKNLDMQVKVGDEADQLKKKKKKKKKMKAKLTPLVVCSLFFTKHLAGEYTCSFS